MNIKLSLLAILFPILISAQSQDKKRTCAISKIEQSINAFGGKELLNSVQSLRVKAKGYRLMREQSERPEGPYITDYFDLTETNDFQHNRWSSIKDFGVFGYSMSYLVNDSITARSFNHNGNWFPAEKSLEEELYLNPLRILQTAAKARSLRCERDTLLQHMEHTVISFEWKKIPVEIFINKRTNLITAVQLKETYPFNNYHVWGDVTKTLYYSLYGLEKNGLRYPYQQDLYINGKLSENMMVTSVEQNLEVSPSLMLPEETAQKIVQYTANSVQKKPQRDKVINEQNGITIIPGSWFSAVVKQQDGLVIIDSPINSDYGSGILEMAKELYPDLPIKAVIASSGAWPHVGGLRPFIAAEIPVYHSPIINPILNELATAEFTTNPDELQKNPEKIKPVAISEKNLIGKGPNRMEVYPMNSEGSEGMLMVYFPQHKLLYTSDLVQGINNPDSPAYFREYWKEAIELIDQNKLEVEKIYGMHLAPVKLSELKNVLHIGQNKQEKVTK